MIGAVFVRTIQLFWTFLALTTGVQALYGCVTIAKDISKFDETEYVFIGEVVGYTQPVWFDRDKANKTISPVSLTYVEKHPDQLAVGLIVAPRESVYLPRSPKKNFEVFQFDTWADCTVVGLTLDKVSRDFPVGSEVRVIAKESSFVTPSKEDSVIRLEDRPEENGSVALNRNKDGSRMTTSTSIFDYKSFKFDSDKDPESKYVLPGFELRKDLLRLKLEQKPSEKSAILSRLLSFPLDIPNPLDVRNLVKSNTSSEIEFKRVYYDYLRKTDPEYGDVLIAFEDTLSELIRLGYKEEDAKNAIEKAMEEKADDKTQITYKTLLEGSLKILSKKG